MIYEPREDSLLLQKYVKKYSKGICLDMGTGSGIQVLEAAKKADIVIGLDINKDVIKFCKKNVKKPNIVFFKSNLFQFFEENFVYYDEVDKKTEVYDKKDVKDREKRRILNKKQIKFDLLVFNPPYLPDIEKSKVKDLTFEGGKKGYEVIERFLNDASSYLKKDGKILLVFSSLTNKKKVDYLIIKNNLRFVELEKKHMFFEDIYVYYVAKP
ncbi:MAG: methyltransferase domain-containing protein [Nanoarchaeota archaeon]|nr:methyltransferase domain-containing protein [Nanoarchaeota archaeon]